MRSIILGFAGAMAVAAGSVTSASAADMFVPPPLEPVFSWTGCYIGGHAGWGRAEFDGIFDSGELDLVTPLPEDAVFLEDLDVDGFVGGGQIGCNWQMNQFILGAEGDFSFTDWDDRIEDISDAGANDAVKAEVNFLASLRGKAGFAFDRFMIYGTGGIAFADGEATFIDELGDVDLENRGTIDFDDIGFVVGGGADWMVWDNISVGVVGLWYIFNDDEDACDFDDGAGDCTFTDDSDEDDFAKFEDAFVIRANLNYHF